MLIAAFHTEPRSGGVLIRRWVIPRASIKTILLLSLTSGLHLFSLHLQHSFRLKSICLYLRYLSKIKARSVVEFAWAIMAAAPCESTLYFAKLVLSSAISTSTIRPRAARILVRCWANIS